MSKKKRVLIAMSGGVDSSVAAFLLKQEKKYDVIGVSFKLFAESHIQNIRDAQAACEKLGLPFYSFDYTKEFREEVIDYFCAEYVNGRTPNPCAVCNEKIKFAQIFDKAETMGADYIATGHYVKKTLNKKNNRYTLKKGKDKSKDQSYFLFSLSQEQLKRALFPLGDCTKEEVRRLAGKIGLETRGKPESQDICFISGRDYHEFLKEHLGNIYMPGLIVNSKGETVGEHKGIPFYTIGQRKGLGPHPVRNKSPRAAVAPKARISNGAHKKPVYVIRIVQEKNVIVIGEENELYTDSLIAENVNWIAIEPSTLNRTCSGSGLKIKAKTRYKSKEAEVVVFPAGRNTVSVKFKKPQRAITPGQAVVFYDKDTVVGGGWIK